MNNKIPKGVITGKGVQKVFRLAKEKSFALPAVNVTGSNSINAVLETASKINSPVIFNFLMVVLNLILVKDWQILINNQLYMEQSLELNTFIN